MKEITVVTNFIDEETQEYSRAKYDINSIGCHYITNSGDLIITTINDNIIGYQHNQWRLFKITNKKI